MTILGIESDLWRLSNTATLEKTDVFVVSALVRVVFIAVSGALYIAVS